MFKKILTLLMSLSLILSLAACSNSTTQELSGRKTYDISEISKAKLVTSYSQDTLVDQMDTVTFGSYPQSDSSGNTKEPIEWIVLDRQGDKTLLLSKYILDCKCYNNDFVDVTWETCSLRNWLKNDFYYKAFNSDEQNKIQSTFVINANNIDYGTNGGNSTTDKVFCLSTEEVRKYFGDGTRVEYGYHLGKKVATRGTNYAKAVDNYGVNLWVYDGSGDNQHSWATRNSVFWLRSPGSFQVRAARVDYDGYLYTNGDHATFSLFGVRPAIWVSTSQLSQNSGVNESQNGNINNYTTTQELSGRKTYDISEISKAKLVTSYSQDTLVDQMDTVTFGSYPQSDSSGNTKEPIEWIVLDRQGNKTLLLSKYILDCKCYNNDWFNVTWETCSLRNWLNSEFINTIFSKKDQGAILTTDVVNSDNAEYGTAGGNNTKDKLFLLSIDEVNKYFSDNQRVATEIGGNYGVWWWLRSPGSEQDRIACVDYSGCLLTQGIQVDNDFGVRPAIWVSTSQLSQNSDVNESQNGNNNNYTTTQALSGRKTYDISEISKAKLVSEYNDDTTVDMMDTVTFGSYPQSDVTGNIKEPIEWIVLDRDGDKTLLLSKYILDCKCYSDEWNEDITWENSTLRYWLNNTFYNSVFNSNEKSYIKTTYVINTSNNIDNENYDYSDGKDTYDNIFLLSIDEVDKYFQKTNDWDKRITYETNYEKAVNVYGDTLGSYTSALDGGVGSNTYWLRNTNALEKNSIVYVDSAGEAFVDNGMTYALGFSISGGLTGHAGVRPALWVSNLTSAINQTNETQSSNSNPYIILQKSDVKNLKYVKKRDGFLGLFGNVHYYVDIELINDVKDRFKDITGKNIGSIVNMIKDNGIYISSAVIKEQINNGRFNIESNSQVKAQDIANELTNSENYYFLLSKSATYDINVGRKAISDGGYTLKDYDPSRIYIIGLPSEESELRDNHFYKNNQMQKLTWVYYQGYYYYVDKDGNIIKNKWVDGRFVGEDGKLYLSRKTPDNKWVGGDGLEVENVTKDLEDSLTVEEAKSDSWYRTELGLWYYFENDRKTTKKGWFHDTRDDQWYYLDPATGIMAIGWTIIDGNLYYFNEFPGREQNWYETSDGFYESYGKKVKALGSLYMNEYTPYGSFVDENGKLVQ